MRILLVLVLACLTTTVWGQTVLSSEELPFEEGAQDLPIRFENITLEDGLSQSTVYSILHDRKGFMWFGTEIGLNRYDGHTMVNYLPDPFDSTSVHDSYIWSLTEDADGGIWMTYEDGSVSRFDPATGKNRTYQSSGADSTRFAPGRNNTLVIDAQGRIWTGNRGLQLLDPVTGRVTRFYEGDWDTPGGVVWLASILVEESGTLLVAGREGLKRFDPDTGEFEPLAPARGTWALVRDPHDPEVVWFGGLEGAHRYDLSSGTYRLYDVTDGPQDLISQVRPDPHDSNILWVSTREGLARLNEETGDYMTYRAATSDAGGTASTGLLANAVGAIYQDRAGILWASAGGAGVSRFDPTAIGFAKDASRPDDPNSMRGQVVWEIAPASNGILWVAAVGSETSQPGWYLNRIDRRTGRVQYWRTWGFSGARILIDSRGRMLWGSNTNPNVPTSGGVWTYDERRSTIVPLYTVSNGLLPNDGVNTMLETRSGVLWVGTSAGLVRFAPEGRTEWLDTRSGGSLRNASVRYILEDSRGDVWVSVARDLYRFEGGGTEYESIRDRDDMPSGADNAVLEYATEDLNGDVWWAMRRAGGQPSGVVRYDAASDRFFSLEHDISDRTTWSGGIPSGVMVDPNDADKLYLATYGGGLSRLTISTDRFRHFRAEDGLTNQSVYEGVFDNEGMLWIPSNSGLFEFNPETETFRRFGLEYGLQSLEFNGSSLAKSESGELFFGGVQGFNAFFPSQLRSNDVPPDVAITDFLLFNERVMPGPDSPLKTSISDTDEIRLSSDQDSPSFRFAALHYKRPESNLIRYRLEPQDADWVDADGRNEASYTNLRPGEYTFRVIAANSDGVWNAEGAAVRLIVAPPWWTRWWAYLIYLALLAAGVFGVDRFQRARIAERQRNETRERELEHAKEVQVAYNELQQTKQQLVEQEKLASLGSLTAGIAHEIKNPLNFVNNFAEVNEELAEELSEAVASGDTAAAQALLKDLAQNAAQIAKHGKRADGIVRAMMQHARGGSGEMETFDLNEFIGEYVNLAWHGMRAQDHAFTAEVIRRFDDKAGVLTAQPQDLGRVILNLLNNAFYAVQEKAEYAGESYKPAIIVSTKRSANEVRIILEDNGPGIPEDVRARIFEPFFTTKPTGQGTGLGLSLSYDIVTKAHGGSMTVGESSEGGAQFILQFPV